MQCSICACSARWHSNPAAIVAATLNNLAIVSSVPGCCDKLTTLAKNSDGLFLETGRSRAKLEKLKGIRIALKPVPLRGHASNDVR